MNRELVETQIWLVTITADNYIYEYDIAAVSFNGRISRKNRKDRWNAFAIIHNAVGSIIL